MYHQVRTEVQEFSPAAFLRMGTGQPRGLWARGVRWVAHVGLLEDIVVPPQVSRLGPLARFEALESEATRLFDRQNGGVPPRLFGGFSFAPHHEPDDPWDAFPPGRFHLPAVELEFDGVDGRAWLRVRDADEGRAAEALQRWQTGLEAARSAEAESGAGDGRPAIEAATAGMDRSTWGDMVRSALERIECGEVDKVVLARTLKVVPDRPLEPLDLALALWEENRGSHVFLFEPVPGRAMIGAAPETVTILTGDQFRATAVAGSVGVGATSMETAQLAGRLFDSAKDRAEHDFVVEDMVSRLEQLGCAVRRDIEPHVLTLARIQHLETKIAAELPEDVTLLRVLGVLHPTPAVCGIPRDTALATLGSREVFDRGWYAGPVGWLDGGGDGIFVPALRSAVCSGGTWCLFAGAGIVRGSDPDLEWEETGLKFQPVLRAMVNAGLSERVLAEAG